MRSTARLCLALTAISLIPFAAACEAEDILGSEDDAAEVDGSQISAEFSEAMPFTLTVDPAELATAIEALTVAEEADDGYDRSLFPHWRDDDDNGCDARDDTLVAEDRSGSLDIESCGGAMTGEWVSMFDGEVITESGALDVDHVVPLKEAWGSGAHAWSTEQRQEYANSLGEPWHLLAVTAASNRSKSDKDPADWMPPSQDVWCAYTWIWVQIKTDWDLSVDEAERDALLEQAAAC